MPCRGRRLVTLDDRVSGLHGLFIPTSCFCFFPRVEFGLRFRNCGLAWLRMDLNDLAILVSALHLLIHGAAARTLAFVDLLRRRLCAGNE